MRAEGRGRDKQGSYMLTGSLPSPTPSHVSAGGQAVQRPPQPTSNNPSILFPSSQPGLHKSQSRAPGLRTAGPFRANPAALIEGLKRTCSCRAEHRSPVHDAAIAYRTVNRWTGRRLWGNKCDAGSAGVSQWRSDIKPALRPESDTHVDA